MKTPKKYLHKWGEVNQNLLQTGKPKGYYSRGDKHPTIKNFFYRMFCPKTKKENWVHQSHSFFEKVIKPRLGKKKRKNLLTLKTLRTDGKIKFKCGDQHPKLKNYYFHRYCRGRETWETKEEKKIRLQRKKDGKDKIKVAEYNKLQWEKVKNDPEYKAKKAKQHKEYSQRPDRKKRRSKVLKVWLSIPHNGIAHSLRCRLRDALKSYKVSKCDSATELLGITIPEFMKYFESKFTDGMSWNNHGEWHIDHIVPCASFDLTKKSEQKKCFHYTNLQPLWAHDNLSKGSKLDWQKSA